MRPQRPDVESMTSRRNQIGDQPLIAGPVFARNHRALGYSRMMQQRRLDLARLNAEPADLHLLVSTPEEVEHPIRTPAHQVASAIHPAPGRPERIRYEPLAS